MMSLHRLTTGILMMSTLSHAGLSVADTGSDRSFGKDVRFLRSHVELIVLAGDDGQAQVAVVPAYQGRVMTSTATGDNGTSYGWIHYDQVEEGVDANTQINVFGGEERFWLGPEGGQFSIFFPAGAKFEFSKWQTPAIIDTVAYDITNQTRRSVSFRHEGHLTNYSGTKFQIRIDREVELLSNTKSLEIDDVDANWVGYRTLNRLTNTGENAWTKETGLLSIWLLGMYKHGPETTVVIPFKQGPASEWGPIVNDAYFGEVPDDRLKIEGGVLYFAADGKYRSKIGLSPSRATPICGSYDAGRGVLTIVTYNQPPGEVTDYVNSMWELQDEPFAGDVINAYNDGPPEPGANPLGPFYELETSSPALALQSGETGEHEQETYHFEGDKEALDRLSQQLLGVSLAEIEQALR